MALRTDSKSKQPFNIGYKAGYDAAWAEVEAHFKTSNEKYAKKAAAAEKEDEDKILREADEIRKRRSTRKTPLEKNATNLVSEKNRQYFSIAQSLPDAPDKRWRA